MAEDPKTTPPTAGAPSNPPGVPTSTTLGGGSVQPPTAPGAQQAHTSVQQQAAASVSKPGDAAVSSNVAGNKEAAAAQQRLAEARKRLADAEAEVAKYTASPETTADQDKKQADQFAAEQARQQGGLTIIGRPGGPFNIDGVGFGDGKGELRVGNRTIDVTRWNDKSIKGTLPADIGDGDIYLRTAGGAELKGKYSAAKKVGPEQDVVVRGQPVSR